MTEVVDPTGAGDSFAGGFFGHLASQSGEVTIERLKKACLYGSITASFTIQGFGVTALADLTKAQVEERLMAFRRVVSTV